MIYFSGVLNILVFTIFALSPISPLVVADEAKVVTLEEALHLSHQQSLTLAVSKTKIDKALALQAQALAARYPKVLGTGIAAPLFKVTGDANQSRDDYHTWGAWLQGSLTILQPIYAWGKLDALRDAAASNLKVQEGHVRLDELESDYNIKEVYWGSVLVEQMYQFLSDGKKDLEEIDNKIAAEDHDASGSKGSKKNKKQKFLRRDVFRYKVFRAEADYRLAEAEKFRTLARHALSFRIGRSPDEETLPADVQLVADQRRPRSEVELLNELRSHRPEMKMVREGIFAKNALLIAERANKMPMVFLGGMLTFAYSNVRTPQTSAFAFDPYNRSSGGIGVGAQWNFDFKTTLANESAILAEIKELEKQQIMLEQGVMLELRKALADLTEARLRYEASKDAFQVGKKWLLSETMNYSLGLGEIKDLIDAYLARAKTAKDHWESIYKLHMAWAQLSKVVGTDHVGS